MTQPMKQTAAQQPEPDVAEETTPVEPVELPSWFARTYTDKTPAAMAETYAQKQRPTLEDLAQDVRRQEEAYETYRRRLDERFAAARHHIDPVFAERVAELPVTPQAAPQRPSYRRQEAASPVQKGSGLRPITLAILTLSACIVGGTGGYVAANPDSIGKIAGQAMAYASTLRFLPTAAPTETIVPKKPVQTAKLEVNDTSGAVNAPIPLDITALPINAETPVAIRISGLPEAAYLTKGVEVAQGEWVLKSADIAKAELVVPRANSPILALQVAALEEKTGLPAAPAQDMKVAIDLAALPVPGVPQPPAKLPQVLDTTPVITPVNAVPNQGFNKQAMPLAIPVPIESLNAKAVEYIAKGDLLLGTGDVLNARQFYMKAFDLKVTAAAYGVGQTYDPTVYTRHNIIGLMPDATKAAEWYGKAAATGHEEAAQALAQLPAR